MYQHIMSLQCKGDFAYIVPIGDIHLGHREIIAQDALDKLQGYIDWIGDPKNNAYTFLNGDIFDVATMHSVSSPFDQVGSLNEHIKFAEKLFRPIRKRIIGAVRGNHENRLRKLANFNPLETLCAHLDIQYYNISVVIRLDVGQISYLNYFHHTTGGGGTPGGKLNRTRKMCDIYPLGDVFFGSHSHSLHATVIEKIVPNRSMTRNVLHRQAVVGCGHYLSYNNSYAEEAMLECTKTGSPRVRYNGKIKDVHVSL